MSKQLEIIYREESPFILAMNLVFCHHYKKDKQQMSIGYAVHENSIYLFDYKNNDKLPITEFPYPMNCYQVTNFVWGWLQNNEPREKDGWYGGDGDNIKGWKITTDKTGPGSDNWGSFVRIQPYFIYYGK